MSYQDPDSLTWLQHPENWPNWPFQTVKQSKAKPGHLPRVGLVIDFGGVTGKPDLSKLRFVEANLYGFSKEDMEAAKTAGPVDLEKLLAEGWVVD